MDAVAGAPNPVSLTKRPPEGPRVVEVPPSRLELLLGRVLRPLRSPGAWTAVWYLRAVAAVDAVTALVPPLRSRVREAGNGAYVAPFMVGPSFTGAALAFLLSVGLRRRKRAAWIAVTALSAAYTVTVVVALSAAEGAAGRPVNWVALALTAAVLLALLVSRTAFNVRGATGNAMLGTVCLVVGAAVATGAGTLLVYATDRDPPAQWGPSAAYAAVRALTLSGLVDHPGIRVPAWADVLVNLMSLALALLVVLAFLRAPRGRARIQPADERRLRRLLRAGRDSLGYLALRRDRTVCWSPRGDAAVVHKVVNGVALASGDPVGPVPAWPAAVGHWLETARRHAWVPAVAHAGAEAAGVYAAAGLRALPCGPEPVVAVGPLPPGPAEVRRAMAEAGYSVLLRRQADVPAPEWESLRQLAAAWRQRGPNGRAPALERLGDPADPDCVLAECRDPHGRTCALLLFAPWGTGGLALVMLRHDRESGTGPVDLVLTEVLLRASAGAPPVADVDRVSLNLPPARPRGVHRGLRTRAGAASPAVRAAGRAAPGARGRGPHGGHVAAAAPAHRAPAGALGPLTGVTADEPATPPAAAALGTRRRLTRPVRRPAGSSP
jgi:lysyl-tRNA synthetase class 2